jgi:hypothetical protein
MAIINVGLSIIAMCCSLPGLPTRGTHSRTEREASPAKHCAQILVGIL